MRMKTPRLEKGPFSKSYASTHIYFDMLTFETIKFTSIVNIIRYLVIIYIRDDLIDFDGPAMCC